MYDDLDRSWREPSFPPLRDRLAHLVLIDGRLVDAWTEPVEGTRWHDEAVRIDRERRPAPPPAPPQPPQHEQVLAWLREACGGAEALFALGTDPLVDDGSDLPERLDPDLREQAVEAGALLDGVAHALFGREAGIALRRGLVALCVEAPETAASMSDVRQLAAGVCWAVGKANDLFDSTTGRTQARVKGVLGWSGQMPAVGKPARDSAAAA